MLSKNLLLDVKSLINNASANAIRSVDHFRTVMYLHIGERIFNEEQQGKDRADYGNYLIKYLSEQLQPEFGNAFSYRQLELMRQFYRTYPIANSLRSQLSWTHYRLIIRIDNEEKREYYLAETSKNNWSVRQMERQILFSDVDTIIIRNHEKFRNSKYKK